MDSALWYIAAGILLIAMVLISASLKRLSLTAAIFYFLIGVLLGNSGITNIRIDPIADSRLLRLLTEVAVVISLFTAGLKLRLPLNSSEWRTPLLLASVSMVITIAVISTLAFFFLNLSIGAAILLGAILAPTDPVLASSVQVLGPGDVDRLRFSLTAEAGLNDGTAFPFVILGLGLLGLSDLGAWGSRWFAVDLLWGISGGLAIGTCLAIVVSKLIGVLRSAHKESRGYDDFLALGLISLSYGLALQFNANGFLAVFAAGLALRRRERQETHNQLLKTDTVLDAKPFVDSISSEMARSILHFNEQMERFCELVVVIVVGMMVSVKDLSIRALILAATVILIARPISVFLGVRVHRKEHRPLLAWFGIRGMGSLYYLTFAIESGLEPELARAFVGYVLSVVVISILIHGLSSARLMLRHNEKLAV